MIEKMTYIHLVMNKIVLKFKKNQMKKKLARNRLCNTILVYVPLVNVPGKLTVEKNKS